MSSPNPTKPTKAVKTVAEPKGPTTAELLARIDNLEDCLAKMAHFLGGAVPRVIKEFGLEAWSPDKVSMTKYK